MSNGSDSVSNPEVSSTADTWWFIQNEPELPNISNKDYGVEFRSFTFEELKSLFNKTKKSKDAPRAVLVDAKAKDAKNSLIDLIGWREKIEWLGPKRSPLIGLIGSEEDEASAGDIREQLHSIADDDIRFIQWEELKNHKLFSYYLTDVEARKIYSTIGYIAGPNEVMRRVYEFITRFASTDMTILITGETGTGKELLAKSIHHYSKRSKAPYVICDCTTKLASNLMESEVFGHVKGAFTGAISDRVGAVGKAEGGTLFFDEIGELELSTQPKLFRLLSEGTYERLGDSVDKKADVRFIFATNRDLALMVKEGRFRSDLYHRINHAPIHVPPLRTRKADIELLVQYFIGYYCKGKTIKYANEEVMTFFKNYHWSGNIRELRNAIQYSCVYTDDRQEITLQDLHPDLRDEIKENEISPIEKNEQREEFFNKIRETKLENLADDKLRKLLSPHSRGGEMIKLDLGRGEKAGAHLEIVKAVLENVNGSLGDAAGILKKAGYDKASRKVFRNALYGKEHLIVHPFKMWYRERFPESRTTKTTEKKERERQSQANEKPER